MLFKTSNTLQEFAQLAGELDMSSIRITMEAVEEKYLRPVLGATLLNSLQTAYKAAANDAAFTGAANIALIDMCRRVTAPFFCYHFAPKTDVQVSDAGVQRTETTTNKTAYQYQNTAYREENFNQGQEAVEKLIEFLEINKANYSGWVDSAEFKRYRSLFIKTAEDFNYQYPSHTPYRNFWAMRPKMIDVETLIIRKFLGNIIFAELKVKDQLADPGFTDKEKLLIEYIKKITAYHTVAFALPFLNVKIEANGLTVASQNRSTDDTKSTRDQAPNKTISDLVEQCNYNAKMWMDECTVFIKDNATDFATWPGLPATLVTPLGDGGKQLTAVFGLP